MRRAETSLPEEVYEAAAQRAKANGEKLTGYLRRLVEVDLKGPGAFLPELPPLPDPKTLRTDGAKQVAFLDYIANRWSHAGAVVDLGLKPKEVEGWFLKDDFKLRYNYAQRIYVDSIERKLIQLGEGMLKGGNALGFITFLNAHHPGYGRLRREQINRIITQSVKKFMGLLERDLGPAHKDTLKRTLDKFQAWQGFKVSAYTDASVK